ncbi:hypothetical protein [Amycolatopsis anabasis]|uniref:hypothetical protein n=1 Tax=Amycolatopsis anabasis TaxID=1840409 RepID=UPI00131CB324|nr:hypothetical protein [Amycolatopsis anabasis]
MADVQRLEESTREFRALDYRDGGGACRDAVLTALSGADQLLASAANDQVLDRLCVALADLHNLAGWTSFDIGLVDASLGHFDQALRLATNCHHHGLVANICYRMGRVRLHHDAPEESLEHFELGQLSAKEAGSSLAAAILSANQAWAYARMGNSGRALSLLGQAESQLDAADPDLAPPWAWFFDANDFSAMRATVYTELARVVDLSHTRSAIPALTTAIAGYDENMARSRSFMLIMLATNHLLEGDLDEAAAVGVRALEMAGRLTSSRARDRMRPLKNEADRRRDNTGIRDLSDRVAAFMSGQG